MDIKLINNTNKKHLKKIKKISVLLICIIILLSLLDGHEYVKCTHIVLCEFLEINILVNIFLKFLMPEQDLLSPKINFFDFLEGLITDRELMINRLSFCNHNLFKSSEVFDTFLKRDNKDSLKLDHTFFYKAIGFNLPDERLDIIDVSVILS